MISRRGFLKFIGAAPVAAVTVNVAAAEQQPVPKTVAPTSKADRYPKADRLSQKSAIFVFGTWAMKHYGLPPVVQYEANGDPYTTSITKLGPVHLAYMAEIVWLPWNDRVLKNRGAERLSDLPSGFREMMLAERRLMTFEDFKNHGLVRT